VAGGIDIDLPPSASFLRVKPPPAKARCIVQQPFLPVVDPVRMGPELTRQLGDRPVAPLVTVGGTSALNAASRLLRPCATGAF